MDIFDAVYLLMTGVGINIFWTFLFFQWDILPHSLTLLSYLCPFYYFYTMYMDFGYLQT